uniref:Breast carcinoma amplified sequence 4 n=1 Tax=Anser brachyrhynchus TaxID=132585 RepID=A0A8B9CV92_9AVES
RRGRLVLRPEPCQLLLVVLFIFKAHSHVIFFSSMQIRSDTSEILEETIPLIKDKVMEMNHVYARIDKLEAFVKMVAHHVSFLEEQVLEAEKSHGTFLNAVCKLFQCATIPSFKNVSIFKVAFRGWGRYNTLNRDLFLE